MTVAARRPAPRARPRPERRHTNKPQKRRHLRAVPDAGLRARPRRLSASRAVFLVASWILVVAFIFGLVVLNVFVAQASFKLSDLHTQVADQERLYRQMRFEVARAEAPQRVAEIAGGMGLIVPDRQEYIVGRQTTIPAEDSQTAAGPQPDNMKALLEGP